MTEKMSGGRIGYLHVRGMDQPSLQRFLREIRTEGEGKEGMIVDVRFNGGGSTAVDILDVLIRTPWLVRTTRGDIEAETVVIACGVWSPRLARMAGASIPLTPAVHQMIDIGPVPHFAGAKSAIEFPIVRDMDTNMYERQDGSGLEVGSYAHRPILHDPDEIALRCVAMATGGAVADVDGGPLHLRPASICVHGDTPGAVGIARAVRAALQRAGVALGAFAAP